MTSNTYFNSFRSVKCSNLAMSWKAWDISTALLPVLCVFWWNNVWYAVKNAPSKPLQMSFQKFNVPRCLGPQELVPLVRVPKPPTIHYQPAIKKCFDSPESLSNLAILLTFKVLFPVVYTNFPKHVKSWQKTWIGLLENVDAKWCFICEFLAIND